MSDFENSINGLENGDSSDTVNSSVEETMESVLEPNAVNEVVFDSSDDSVTVQEVAPEAAPEAKAEEPYQPSYSNSYSNEYTYSPDVAEKKSGKGGKIALSVIAGILGIFVVVVLTISVYTAILRNNGVDLTVDKSGDQEQLPDWSNGRPDYSPDAVKPDTTEPTTGESDTEASALPQSNPDRELPTLEQLAAPDDAMSIPDIYDKVSPSVVGISSMSRNSIATGTGVIFTEDGYIITNAHVIDGAQDVSVLLPDGTEHEAEIIGYDSQSDLAVIKIEATGLTACEFGISEDLRIGELVVAIGNPLGFELYGSITSGIISGKNRNVTIEEREMVVLQTNAAINSGNSGGPLIDAYGRVIGINSAKIAETVGEGVGFAIPIDDALPVIEDLMEFGYVPTRPMLGISGEDITAIMSMFYNMPQGVYVREVTSGSGAEKAGIMVDDIVIGADGETVTCMDDLNKYKRRHSAGDTMVITVYRNGRAIDFDVVLDMATQAG